MLGLSKVAAGIAGAVLLRARPALLRHRVPGLEIGLGQRVLPPPVLEPQLFADVGRKRRLRLFGPGNRAVQRTAPGTL